MEKDAAELTDLARDLGRDLPGPLLAPLLTPRLGAACPSAATAAAVATARRGGAPRRLVPVRCAEHGRVHSEYWHHAPMGWHDVLLDCFV